jgi:hypothetical protein
LAETLRQLYIEKKLATTEIAKRLNCDPKTVTYWMDKFGIPRRTYSEARRLSNPTKRPSVRKKLSLALIERWKRPDDRRRLIKALQGRRLPEETKRKISQSLKGNKCHKGIPHSEESKMKIAEASKKLWRNPKYARKVIMALQKKPNSFEGKLIRLIKENGFPFMYVGNGQVVIDGQVPDFVSTDGSKRVIELFGTPWHDPNHSHKIKVKPSRTEKAKRKFFKSRGYDCLIIWDYELGDAAKVVEKIRTFVKA